MPPFASRQFPAASCVAQASPVHVAAQAEPLQLSSCTATPVGSPGCAVHGFGPGSVEVPVVSRSLMSRVATFCDELGGQSLEIAYTLLPCAWATVMIESIVIVMP